jgi:hypothetical protein
MGLIGVVIGGSMMLLCRARLRVGAEGVGIRNLLGERVFDWSIVRGVWTRTAATGRVWNCRMTSSVRFWRSRRTMASALWPRWPSSENCRSVSLRAELDQCSWRRSASGARPI